MCLSFHLFRSKKKKKGVILEFFSHITHIQPVSKYVHSNFKIYPESNSFSVSLLAYNPKAFPSYSEKNDKFLMTSKVLHDLDSVIAPVHLFWISPSLEILARLVSLCQPVSGPRTFTLQLSLFRTILPQDFQWLALLSGLGLYPNFTLSVRTSLITLFKSAALASLLFSLTPPACLTLLESTYHEPFQTGETRPCCGN